MPSGLQQNRKLNKVIFEALSLILRFLLESIDFELWLDLCYLLSSVFDFLFSLLLLVTLSHGVSMLLLSVNLMFQKYHFHFEGLGFIKCFLVYLYVLTIFMNAAIKHFYLFCDMIGQVLNE